MRAASDSVDMQQRAASQLPERVPKNVAHNLRTLFREVALVYKQGFSGYVMRLGGNHNHLGVCQRDVVLCTNGADDFIFRIRGLGTINVPQPFTGNGGTLPILPGIKKLIGMPKVQRQLMRRGTFEEAIQIGGGLAACGVSIDLAGFGPYHNPSWR